MGHRCKVEKHYTAFRFLANPSAEFRILDHVIVSRAVFGNEEGVDDVDGSSDAAVPITGSPSMSPSHKKQPTKEQPKNYVAQIEALYEDGATGLRYVRLAWFFWPIETCFSIDELKPLPGEIFTSNEVDVCPLTSIRCKVSILPFCKRMPALTLESGDSSELSASHTASPGGTLFARRHYHHRAEVIVEPGNPRFAPDEALTPWLATFLLTSFVSPDPRRSCYLAASASKISTKARATTISLCRVRRVHSLISETNIRA